MPLRWWAEEFRGSAAQGCKILHLVIVHLKELVWGVVLFPVRGVGTVVPPACCNLCVYGHLYVAPLQLFRQQAALRLLYLTITFTITRSSAFHTNSVPRCICLPRVVVEDVLPKKLTASDNDAGLGAREHHGRGGRGVGARLAKKFVFGNDSECLVLGCCSLACSCLADLVRQGTQQKTCLRIAGVHSQ